MLVLSIAILCIIIVLATISFGIPHETYFTPSKVTQYYRHYTESRRTRNQTKTGLLDERTNDHGISVRTTIINLGHEVWEQWITAWKGDESVGMDVPLPQLLDYFFQDHFI